MEEKMTAKKGPNSVFMALLVLFPAVLSLPGCLTYSRLEADPTFVSGVQEDDIPVPIDFRFDKERSYSYIAYTRMSVGRFRSSKSYYYGEHQPAVLVPWYKNQMARDGWGFKDSSVELEKNNLLFTKGDETAIVRIYREFSHKADRYQTVVEAEISPTRAEDMEPEEALNTPAIPVGRIEPAALSSETVRPIESRAGPKQGTMPNSQEGATGPGTGRRERVPASPAGKTASEIENDLGEGNEEAASGAELTPDDEE